MLDSLHDLLFPIILPKNNLLKKPVAKKICETYPSPVLFSCISFFKKGNIHFYGEDWMALVLLKQKEFHTCGELPKVSEKAPSFVLTSQTLEDKTLEDFSGKKRLLYIVPSLDTPTCGTSAKRFNEIGKRCPALLILIISCDLPFAQKRFCVQEGANNIVTLSLMRNKEFGKKYGVLMEDGPLQGLLARAVLLLDEEGKILYSELVSDISYEPHYDNLEKALSL